MSPLEQFEILPIFQIPSLFIEVCLILILIFIIINFCLIFFSDNDASNLTPVNTNINDSNNSSIFNYGSSGSDSGGSRSNSDDDLDIVNLYFMCDELRENSRRSSLVVLGRRLYIFIYRNWFNLNQDQKLQIYKLLDDLIWLDSELSRSSSYFDLNRRIRLCRRRRRLQNRFIRIMDTWGRPDPGESDTQESNNTGSYSTTSSNYSTDPNSSSVSNFFIRFSFKYMSFILFMRFNFYIFDIYDLYFI